MLFPTTYQLNGPAERIATKSPMITPNVIPPHTALLLLQNKSKVTPATIVKYCQTPILSMQIMIPCFSSLCLLWCPAGMCGKQICQCSNHRLRPATLHTTWRISCITLLPPRQHQPHHRHHLSKRSAQMFQCMGNVVVSRAHGNIHALGDLGRC